MATYLYENSDDERFQQLVQALLLPDHPGLQCLPVGQPDGGRDGVVHDDDLRDGVVLQVKFKRSDEASTDNAEWAIAALEREKQKIQRLIDRGATRYIFATNARGTAHLGTGGIDRVRDWLKENLSIAAQCLWRDDIDRRLERSTALQWRYPEVLTGAGAVHLALSMQIGEDRERRSTALKKFVAYQYDKDSEVRFKQVDLRNDLLSLFIDVPATISRRHQSRNDISGALFEAYNRLPSATWIGDDRNHLSQGFEAYDWPFSMGMADLLLDGAFTDQVPKLVIEGAPGQGKSTLAQYVCQVHRARLIDAETMLGAMLQHHRSAPIRFPIKVDLRDLAAWLNRQDPFLPNTPSVDGAWEPSLEAFIARQISAYSGGIRFEAYDVSASFVGTPVLLFLDGLDEVAGVSTRENLIESVKNGLIGLEASGVAIQVVVTSRPAAFAKSPGFPRRDFVYFELVNLTRPLVLDYSRKWMTARNLDKADAEDVERILISKLDLPHIRDLARNPMQLAILLSLIHAVGYSLPDERTDLYASYMERFLTREADKSPTVRRHRKLLVKIHQYLAWILQSRAESAAGLSGSVTPDELRRLIGEYLHAGEHPTEILDELFTGMLERVYVLVQRIEGAYEFEVQPLREYFCATYLYETAPYEAPSGERPRGSRRDRFEALVQNPYWTNVARFYAGCYQSGELGGLFIQLEELREEPDRTLTFRPRQLGAMLLGDWVFKDAPRVTRHVAECVFDDLGLKAAATQFGQGAEGALQLPPGCGREELGNRALAAARRSPGSGSIDDLKRVVRANMTDPLGVTLRAYVDESAGSERTMWLRFAEESGALAECGVDEFRTLLEGDTPGGPDLRLRCLTLARTMPRVAQQIEPVREEVLASFLAGSGSVELAPTAWIELLGNRLSLPLLEFEMQHGARHGRPVSVGDLLGLIATVPESLTSVREFLEMVEKDEPHPTGIEPSALERGTRRVSAVCASFGEVWIATAMAILVSSVPGPRGTRGEGVESIFDPSKSLVERTRRARYWTGSSRWWGDQLALSGGTQDEMMWCVLAIMWGKGDSVVKYQGELESILARLSDDQYRDLYTCVAVGARQPGARAVSRARQAQALGSKASIRLEALLDECSPRTARSESAGECADPIVDAVRKRRRYEALVHSLSTENCGDRLSAIRELYPAVRTAFPRLGNRRLKLTEAVASEILSRPLEYPSEFVLASEERIARTVKVKLVSEIAAESRWSFE